MARSGTILAASVVVIGAVFGIGLWYSQTQSYYTKVDGLTELRINGQTFGVSGYTGTDGVTSPLKLRGCFVLDDPQSALAAGEPAPKAVPLTTPDWIECFDELKIDADIRSGKASAIMAGEDEGDGADLYLAIYPDGRGYQWRQPNEKYDK